MERQVNNNQKNQLKSCKGCFLLFFSIPILVTFVFISWEYISPINPAMITSELAQNTIISVSIIPFNELPQELQEEIGAFCCTYSQSGGWMPADMVGFEPFERYLVKAVIDVTALARLTFKTETNNNQFNSIYIKHFLAILKTTFFLELINDLHFIS